MRYIVYNHRQGIIDVTYTKLRARQVIHKEQRNYKCDEDGKLRIHDAKKGGDFLSLYEVDKYDREYYSYIMYLYKK